jgi:AraC-like DNA-binding protein
MAHVSGLEARRTMTETLEFLAVALLHWISVRAAEKLRSMKDAEHRLRVLRLKADSQIVLTSAESVVLVVGTGCVLQNGSGERAEVEAGTLLVRDGHGARPDLSVVRAIAIMQSKLAEPLRVSALARAVGCSRAAFARRFVAATGSSPHQFMNALRIERAAQLLSETDRSVAEIAEQVGYASEFAFSRAFKRQRGVAPSIYRKHSRGSSRTLAIAA